MARKRKRTTITSIDQVPIPTYSEAIADIFLEGWELDNTHYIQGTVFSLPFKVLWLLIKSIVFFIVRIAFIIFFSISALFVLHVRKKQYKRYQEFFENPDKYW